jgi:phosphohistidine phosphatase SixA
VSLQRHVNVEPGDSVAWFDETFDNAAYGECRGSGVLAKRGDHWVLRQYHLTIPVPNDLAPDVVARIRAFQGGPPPAATTIVVVRHAEKASEGVDPDLSEAGRARAAALAKALRDVPFTAVFTTPHTRTSQTVAPLCKEKGLTRKILLAGNVTGLADELRKLPHGEIALVCGHSNTVPNLLKALGVKEAVTIAEDEYDRLFVVTLDPQGVSAQLLALRYPGP